MIALWYSPNMIIKKSTLIFYAGILSVMLPVRADGCYRNTTEIYLVERSLLRNNAAVAISETRTYVLCPNTTFPIGRYSFGLEDYEGGMAALVPWLPNVHILCGEDGKSENGCILEGGSVHVNILPEDYPDEVPFENVMVQGVTFKGATEYNVIGSTALTSKSVVLFRDCIFTENDNFGLVEGLVGFINATDAMTLAFDRCTFEFNVARPEFGSANETYALVNNGEHILMISSSVFRDNKVEVKQDNLVGDVRTFLIGNEAGGFLNVTNCRFDKNIISFALLFSDDPETLVENGNTANANNFSFENACEGAAVEIDPVSQAPAVYSVNELEMSLDFRCNLFFNMNETTEATTLPTESSSSTIITTTMPPGSTLSSKSSSSSLKLSKILNSLVLLLLGTIDMFFLV